jgi:hypothetical protein
MAHPSFVQAHPYQDPPSHRLAAGGGSSGSRIEVSRQHALLARVVGRCAFDPGHDRSRPTPVVVFDLDGTLFDNRPRTRVILGELADSWRKTHPDLATRLGELRQEEMAYLLSDTLARIGVNDAARVDEAQAFWKARFFADEHLRHDEPLPGAVDFAKACYAAGAILVYLTGRDLPLMGIGSFRSLRDHGFPIGVPGTELVLKPDAAMADETFKRFEAPKLARVGSIVASFDNEPANCNTLLAQNPGCDSVLVDTQHLPGAPPLDPGVHVIADFRRA